MPFLKSVVRKTRENAKIIIEDVRDVTHIWLGLAWHQHRYSVCSAVGILPLALHYGFEVARRFLDGAHDMDNHFLNEPPRQNIPVLMGLLGVWNSTFLGYGSRALLPYSQALLRFAAHIQQVSQSVHQSMAPCFCRASRPAYGCGYMLYPPIREPMKTVVERSETRRF